MRFAEDCSVGPPLRAESSACGCCKIEAIGVTRCGSKCSVGGGGMDSMPVVLMLLLPLASERRSAPSTLVLLPVLSSKLSAVKD